MKGKRTVIIFMLIIFFVIILAVIGAKTYIEANLERVAGMSIPDVDLSKTKDGVYSGSYKAFPVAADVEVTVNNKKITNIELKKHNNGQGSQAEIIPDKVIEAQTLEVDIVSGATYSSKVILKAIENALNNADNL
jgi:uncharacterized protein with FMN-binding domain